MKIVRTRPSVNHPIDWLDQFFLIPGLVWKRISPVDVITMGHSSDGGGVLDDVDKKKVPSGEDARQVVHL